MTFFTLSYYILIKVLCQNLLEEIRKSFNQNSQIPQARISNGTIILFDLFFSNLSESVDFGVRKIKGLCLYF